MWNLNNIIKEQIGGCQRWQWERTKWVKRKVRPLTKACSLQLIISMKRSRHWFNIVSAGTDMYKSPFSRETSPNRVTC